MAKIKFKFWVKEIAFQKLISGYKIDDGFFWHKTTSEHGKSMASVTCPCCRENTEVYIWSFMGGGKRCSNCNVLMGSQGAFLYNSEVTKEIQISHTHIKTTLEEM